MSMKEVNDYLEWRAQLETTSTDVSPEAWEWSKTVNVVIGLVSDERRDNGDVRDHKQWDRELARAIDNVKQAKETLDAKAY